RTGARVEIHLVIENNRTESVLIEIKSTHNCHDQHLAALRGLGADFGKTQMYVLCQEKRARVVDGIRIMPWRLGLDEIFGIS
ncbi:MAG: hypothetical protein AAB425_01750, partial [Bdellovibrionota bacterium]